MVQEFHVLRCFSCETFQVQQVKKSKKWSCKVCGEKQSLIKEFGRGSAGDCRRHVQKLNTLRGEMMELRTASTHRDGDDAEGVQVEVKQQVESRWSKYVVQSPSADGDDEEEEELVSTDPKPLTGEETRKRKKASGVGEDTWTAQHERKFCSGSSTHTRSSLMTRTHTVRSEEGHSSPSSQSKWSRFLTVGSGQQEHDEGDDDDCECKFSRLSGLEKKSCFNSSLFSTDEDFDDTY